MQMETAMRMETTLREYLHYLNRRKCDEDVYVDGTDFGMAVCGGEIRFSDFALDYYKDALELPFDWESNLVFSNNDSDYDDYDDGKGVLDLAVELIQSLAGYCPISWYDKCFEDDAKLI